LSKKAQAIVHSQWARVSASTKLEHGILYIVNGSSGGGYTVGDPGKKVASDESSGGIRIKVGTEDTLTREDATATSLTSTSKSFTTTGKCSCDKTYA
jgi:hypothetical protein